MITSPCLPMSLKSIAHGYRKAISTSNTRNKMATW